MRLIAIALSLVLSSCATTSAAHAPADAIPELSKRYLAAMDALDATAMEAFLAPEFNRVGRSRFYDRKQVLTMIAGRAKTGFPKLAAPRTFEAERLRVEGDTAVFTAYSTAELQVNAEGRRSTAESTQTLVWAHGPSGWKLIHHQAEDAGLEAERANWNEVFRQSTGFNLKPNRFLTQVIEGRTPGKALDIGVGQGRNALFLASKGWTVTGVDIADEGVRQTLESAKSLGVTVDAQVQDATTWDWGENQWDLICLIYEGGAQYVEKVVRALKPGGIVVLEYFHSDSTRGNGAGGFKTNEVPELFKALKTVKYEEVVDRADYGLAEVRLVRFVGQK